MSSIRNIFLVTLVFIANINHHEVTRGDTRNQYVIVQQKSEHLDLKTCLYLCSKSALKMKSDNRLSALYVTVLLLTKCHFPEPNPGPRSPKYPCGLCQKSVKTIDQAVLCDNCETWFHIDCEHINETFYNCLIGSDCSWYCTTCGLPNFATSLFETSLIPESINNFSTLDNSNFDASIDDTQHPGSPQMASSPKQKPTQKKRNYYRKPLPNDTERIKIIVLNCRSLRQRKDIFQTAIGKLQADVVIGTESWLDKSIKSEDIFPEEFKGGVYRKDRGTENYGGVFVAIKNCYVSEEAEEFKSNAETIWAKMSLPSGNNLFVGSIYNNKTRNVESLEEIKKNLKQVTNLEKNTIWVGGDLNLPDIDWQNPSKAIVKEHSKNSKLHQDLIDFTADVGLEQCVYQPTREENTLICSSRTNRQQSTEQRCVQEYRTMT